MRVRIALGLAFLAAAIGLVIDMSGSAPRLAGSDHVYWPAAQLDLAVPGGGVLCVDNTALPSDTARMVMTISAARPLPRLTVAFTSVNGRRTLATGTLKAGSAPGEEVSVPLRYPHGPSAIGRLCIHVGGHHAIAFGGWGNTFGSTIDGVTQPGNPSPSILYYRPGSESWWQLLGAVDLRLGLGKSPMFGRWTLPVLVLAALALWFGVARVLVREAK